ncbi:hypothetical protein ACFOKF_02900 [Sphingobium rhizovicinum]|uniref:Uncharacterized protein n=1 Tax=Sphingobium rhizovicinum TaxID=432308 RepID=A0ABV7NCH4_9SPHN
MSPDNIHAQANRLSLLAPDGRFALNLPESPAPQDAIAFIQRHGFDVAAYQARYSDMAVVSTETATRHFAMHGWRENRLASFAHLDAMRQSCMSNPQAGWMRYIMQIGMQTLTLKVLTNCRTPESFAGLVQLLAPRDDALPMLVIGDSHTAFLNQPWPMLAAGMVPAPILCSGGSARGLANPNPRADYRGLIFQRLSALGMALLHRPVLFKFGQVDVEFVFDMKRIREGVRHYDGAAARSFIAQSIERYGQFLDECRQYCRGRMIVMGIFPPTLSDETIQKGYINAHIAFLNAEDDARALQQSLAALEHPDIVERMALARYTNALIADVCARRDLPFIDEFDALLGSNGMVLPELAIPTDHHLALAGDHGRRRIMAVGRQIHALAMA